MNKFFVYVVAIFLFFNMPLFADASNGYKVGDIKLHGLKVVKREVVFATIFPDFSKNISKESVSSMVKNLYSMGYFLSIKINKSKNILNIYFKERAIINTIKIEGSGLISEEQILESLEKSDIKKGKILATHVISKVISGIKETYELQGRFGTGVVVETKIKKNTANLTITIDEASETSIEKIIITGNTAITDDKIKKIMTLKGRSVLNLFDNNSYSGLSLKTDLNNIDSYYHNRGYLDEEITSHQVKFSPDKKQIYVFINLSEGKRYRVGEVKIIANKKVNRAIIKKIKIKKGSFYNDAEVQKIKSYIKKDLEDSGYLYSYVGVVTNKDSANNIANLTITIKPKHRVLVRRISFVGNKYTADSVIREQIRQVENSVYSKKLVNLSLSRVRRMGYFSSVTVKNIPVDSSKRSVDLEFTVVEQQRNSVSLNLSYSEINNLSFGGGFSSKNILGSGEDLNISTSYSESSQDVTVSHYNKSFLSSEFSLDSSLFYHKLDNSKRSIGITSYNISSSGLGFDFGYSLSNDVNVNYGLTYLKSDVTYGASVQEEIRVFLEDKGSSYADIVLSTGIYFNDLNLGFMPTEGAFISLVAKLSLPNSSNEFGNILFKAMNYFPITKNHSVVWKMQYDNKYGFAYGNSEYYPFYKYWNAGGMYSVRGYKYGSIGPKSQNYDGSLGSSFGGNLFYNFKNSLIIGNEYMRENNSRLVAFVDSGSVFNTSCIIKHSECDNSISTDDIKYSYGLAYVWYLPIGPISFSYALPINPKEEDRLESYQFSIGYAAF